MSPLIKPDAGPEDSLIFYDIHTHRRYSQPGVVSILSLAQPDWLAKPEKNYFSVGLHPWFLIKDNLEDDLRLLETLVADPNLKAVGECGLDRLRGASVETQIFALERQIRLAEQIRKPVVLHCVKAFPELIRLKKKLSPAVPLIIHGFNNNLQILRSLLDAGFYITLGAALLRSGSNAAQAIFVIPTDRLFLETDDSGMKIEDIYLQAVALLNIEINQLKSIIRRNFTRLFDQADNI